MRLVSFLILTLVATGLGERVVRNHGHYLREGNSEASLLKLLEMLEEKMGEKEMNMDSTYGLRVRSGIDWEDCSKYNYIIAILLN